VADLKIGQYMGWGKAKSTARNRCATKIRKKQIPHKMLALVIGGNVSVPTGAKQEQQ
jgi:hypothetical protein